MANKVNQTPLLAKPLSLGTIAAIGQYLVNFFQSLTGVLQDFANTINALVDLQTTPQAPVFLKTYAKAALPIAAGYKNAMIIVSDDTGGLTPAFSDGTNWRRTADRNIIS